MQSASTRIHGYFLASYLVLFIYIADSEGVFRTVPNLEVLELVNVKLRQVPDLSMNTVLLKLDLSGNSFSGTDALTTKHFLGNPVDSGKKFRIKELNIKNSFLETLPGEILEAMIYLETLDVSGNQLHTFPMKSLEDSIYFKSLNLAENNIVQLDQWSSKKNGLSINVAGIVCTPLIVEIMWT